MTPLLQVINNPRTLPVEPEEDSGNEEKNTFTEPSDKESQTTSLFAIEKPFLSIKESVRLCQGTFDREDCRNELDPHQLEICEVCDAHEEKVYEARRLAKDREEEIRSQSQYEHLRYERR